MQVRISAFLVSSFQLGDGNASAINSDECRVQHVLFIVYVGRGGCHGERDVFDG